MAVLEPVEPPKVTVLVDNATDSLSSGARRTFD